MLPASKSRLAAMATFFLFASVGDAVAQSRVVAEKRYTQVAAALQKLIQHEIREKQLPGFSIALVDDQQIVWAQGFGFADPDNKTPATAETVSYG
jgi:CubicO group peptidase (beta-lactamase class C family)